MRITAVKELAVPIQGNIANAMVNFASHDISLVALVSDVIRKGKPVTGYAFNSIGRYAQSGILHDRMIPRLLAADAQSLLDPCERLLNPAKVLETIMCNEKPGGHGDRASAAAAIELAVWDLNAKLSDEPAFVAIARSFGRIGNRHGVNVYAAGGYYYPDDKIERLLAEFQTYRDLGFTAFKMKIGGASLAKDVERIETALTIAGAGANLAVDANGRFELPTALEYAEAIASYGLRWYEEIGDPLDFDLNRRMTEAYRGPIATGENLFSARDVKNLALYGGMRVNKDIFQMDPGLSYGLTEYARILQVLEDHGYSRLFAYPHGGHLINLHIAAGLELGGCEAYPGIFKPFGGYSRGCTCGDGLIRPTDAAGFGLEEKEDLRPWIARLNQ
jgi:L-alanine-DL-glutamate epimerase-like enolase superfamily enzyme